MMINLKRTTGVSLIQPVFPWNEAIVETTGARWTALTTYNG